MYINKNEVKDSNKILYYGAYGTIKNVTYDGKNYGQKIFDPEMYEPSMNDIKKLEIFSDFKCSDEGIYLPKYLISNNNNFHSYLTELYDGVNILNLIDESIDTRIDFLRKAKDLIIKLNKDYKIVHSDIHFGNIMYNKENETVALIDFDFSKFEDLETEKCFLNDITRTYISYNDYDEKLDTYLFNILTLAILFEQTMNCTCYDLRNNRFHNFFFDNSEIKTLEDMKYIRKNENYIIDMIEDKHKNRILKLY